MLIRGDLMKYIFLFLFVLSSTFAFAGYENTKWGESIDSIKKKYPDGTELPPKDNIVTYYVIKEIADNPGSIVQFNFVEKKLMQVTIHVHAQNPLTEADADKALVTLKQKLELKYKVKGEDMDSFPATIFSLPKSEIIMASKTKVLDKGYAPSLVYANKNYMQKLKSTLEKAVKLDGL